MQENHLFEYAIIRVVPRVEREEFINAGIILLSAKQKFLQCRIDLNALRLKALCSDIDIAELREYISSFEHICAGGKQGGPIGMLPISERFRWLTATRSTILQTSKVHPGLCTDPEIMLTKLFSEMVCVEEL